MYAALFPCCKDYSSTYAYVRAYEGLGLLLWRRQKSLRSCVHEMMTENSCEINLDDFVSLSEQISVAMSGPWPVGRTCV